jgi:cell division protein FtsN
MKNGNQKGGFVVGLIVGLLLGLAIALGVALYVAKVPIPFVDKVPQRSIEADEAEARQHKNWNPNANLPGAGKGGARATAASGVVATNPAQPQLPSSQVAQPHQTPPAQTPATVQAPVTAAQMPSQIASQDPSKAAAAASAPTKPDGAYVYFVQAGAFTQANDAEQQRARLAMQGFNAKVYERASNDRTVFRVRIGPFDDRAAADSLLTQVQTAGLEAAVVRAQR